MKFATPLDFSSYVIERKSVPLSFEIDVSSAVAWVFYRHFYADDAAHSMLGNIEGLPSEIAKSWQREYDNFGNSLLQGRFQVSASCHSVVDYIFHYASGFPEEHETDALNDCLELFDIDSTPPNKIEAGELLDLLIAISIAQPFIDRDSKSLVYTGNRPRYMKYVGNIESN